MFTQNKDYKESLPLPPLVAWLKLGFERDIFWAAIHYTLTEQNKISKSYDEIPTSGCEILGHKSRCYSQNLNLGMGILNLFWQAVQQQSF
jgi:iron complex outermembrane receptor protein